MSGLEEYSIQEDSQNQSIILLHSSGHSTECVEEEVARQTLQSHHRIANIRQVWVLHIDGIVEDFDEELQ